MQNLRSGSDGLNQRNRSNQASHGVEQGDDELSRYATRCLMARRLVESGVRFIQIFPPASPNSQPWDSHGNVKTQNESICKITDQPTAALIKDLKQRGLLREYTGHLVRRIWSITDFSEWFWTRSQSERMYYITGRRR